MQNGKYDRRHDPGEGKESNDENEPAIAHSAKKTGPHFDGYDSGNVSELDGIDRRSFREAVNLMSFENPEFHVHGGFISIGFGRRISKAS
jgi:hypothetical protein